MSPESQSEEKAIGSTVVNGQPSWNDDQDVLAHLGYKEEFKRDFSRWELFGLSFSIVGVVQSIACVSLLIILRTLSELTEGQCCCFLFHMVVP